MNQVTALLETDVCGISPAECTERVTRETLLLTNTVTVKVISPIGDKAFMEATFIFKKSSIVASSSLLLLVQKSASKKKTPAHASHFLLLKIMAMEVVLVLLTLYQIN